MLIGNKSVLNKHPGRTFTGVSSNLKSPNIRYTFNSIYSLPNGYLSPYTWRMAQKDGSIGSYTLIYGTNNFNSNMAGGMNISSYLAGSSYISNSELKLVLSASCIISSVGTFSSYISGIIDASITLAGSGNLISSVTALGKAISLIISSSDINSDIYALANISAELTPFTELSPESLSRAVWNALSSDLNELGTMGNKMNLAGLAGDPWTTVLPGSYTGDEAGNIINRLENLISQVKALTAAQI